METRIEKLLIAHGQDVTGTTKFDKTVTLFDQSGAVGREDVVGTTDHDGRPGAKTRRRCRRRADLAHHLSGPRNVEQLGPGNGRRRLHRVERDAIEVVEPALDGPVVLHVGRCPPGLERASRRTLAATSSSTTPRVRVARATARWGRPTAVREPSP